MHFSFSINEFDYLIIKKGYTSELIKYGPEIFKDLSVDDNYPFICSIIDYSYEENYRFQNDFYTVYDEIAHMDILSIINHNNNSLEKIVDDNNGCICFVLKKTESTELTESTKSTTNDRFKLYNIADIISLIGSKSEYSYCDLLNMHTLTNLQIYEKDGKIVLIACFD